MTCINSIHNFPEAIIIHKNVLPLQLIKRHIMLKKLIAGSKISYKTIWNIAYSIMLGNLAQTLIAITDTAFLGRLGEVELGAAAMSGVYYYFFTTLAWGVAMGVQIIVARRLGEGRLDKIGATITHGLCMILLFASILFGIIELLTPWLMGAVLTSSNVYDVSMEFLSFRGYGIFFASINFMFRSFYIGLSKTKSISYSTLVMALVNIFLDWALIFGTPYNPALGVKGAAIASVIAEISASIFFIIYTLATNPIKGHKVFKGSSYTPSIIRDIIKLSTPTMLQKFFSYGMWLYFFFMIESMGERDLAVTMVVRNVFMLVGIPLFAMGAAANTLTSRLIGEGRSNEVMPTSIKVLSMSLFITLPIMIFLLIYPDPALVIYTDEIGIINGAREIIPMISIISIAFAVAMVFFETVSGTGYTKHAFYLELITLASYVLVIWLAVSVFETSLIWVWSSEVAYGTVLALLSIWFMRKFNWRKRNI